MMLFVWAVSLFAVPANRKPFVVKQSDGTMLSVVMHGDEAMHFHTTLDGKYVVKDLKGDFCYATFSNDGLFVSTGQLAHDAGNRSKAEKELLETIDYTAIENAVAETHISRAAKYRTPSPTRSAATTRAKTTGEVLVPVLLVEYKDVKFSYTKEDIDKLLNESNYKYDFTVGNVSVQSYGSARDYFIAQSDSLFTPRFVVTDIVTLPQNMAYYGGNNSTGNDMRPQAMIRKGIELSDATMDFSQFDNDGDGEVEFMYCIYAGYAEASGADENTIWPHKWSLEAEGAKKKADNVFLNVYACSSELNMTEKQEVYGKWLAGIGTLCHEFSHCLGLHDVYDVSYASGNWGMDEWDLMASGNYNAYGYIPVGYNSYQKEVCGWKKLEVLEEKGQYSMKPQTQGGIGYKIVNDANPNEYFILENRKREGWDQTLVADGMMIIHVDYDKRAWESNNVNVIAGHPRFQIIPADNELFPYSNQNSSKFYESLAGDLWPGKNNNTEFTDVSLPAAKVYTGGYLGKPVTNIKYENYIASFNFNFTDIEAPIALPATNITDNSFVANWSEVKGASGYIVELYNYESVSDGNGEVEVLVNEDFLNCSKVATAIKEDIDSYMSTPGWYGNNIYSETGMLCIGSLKSAGTLLTPRLNAVGNVALSFRVAKYNSNASNIKLIVEIISTSGAIIAEHVVSSGGTVEFEADVAGEFQIRFSTDHEADNKRVLIDDISVVATMSYKKSLLESVETETPSYEFTDLNDARYAYRVKSVEGYWESEYSGFVEVVMGATSVIEIPCSDDYLEIYTIAGIKVHDGKMYDLKNLPAGIYIVKSKSGVKKIMIE